MTHSPEQLRFLWLHAQHMVVKSCWHFGGSLLRAYSERGHTASISATGLGALVDAGCVEIVGCAGVRLTWLGRKAVV